MSAFPTNWAEHHHHLPDKASPYQSSRAGPTPHVTISWSCGQQSHHYPQTHWRSRHATHIFQRCRHATHISQHGQCTNTKEMWIYVCSLCNPTISRLHCAFSESSNCVSILRLHDTACWPQTGWHKHGTSQFSRLHFSQFPVVRITENYFVPELKVIGAL